MVSALDWGSRGPGFKSRQPDHESAGRRVAKRTSTDATTAFVKILSSKVPFWGRVAWTVAMISDVFGDYLALPAIHYASDQVAP